MRGELRWIRDGFVDRNQGKVRKESWIRRYSSILPDVPFPRQGWNQKSEPIQFFAKDERFLGRHNGSVAVFLLKASYKDLNG